MTETPKRRGRPPGSKNKTIDRTNEPATVESWTTGPYGVNVSIRFKVAMSSEGEFVEVTWPPGWPIPQLNDVIRAGGKAGRVQWVEYDHDAGIIRISAT